MVPVRIAYTIEKRRIRRLLGITDGVRRTDEEDGRDCPARTRGLFDGPEHFPFIGTIPPIDLSLPEPDASETVEEHFGITREGALSIA